MPNTSNMKILVIGTWNPEESTKYLDRAEELGLILAKRGHTLIASPSSGVQGIVAKSYKQNKGKQFIGFYPDLKIMKRVGEEVLIEPDKQIYTNQDYPIRNLLQIKESHAVIGITGGSGTLAEIIAAVNDYGLPTSFYKGSSHVIEGFLRLNESFSRKIKLGCNLNDLVDYLERCAKNEKPLKL